VEASDGVSKDYIFTPNYKGRFLVSRLLRHANCDKANAFSFTGEDELDEERDLIIKEIEKLVRLSV
jgi:hypothetical protein